jgi:hypothetical protein
MFRPFTGLLSGLYKNQNVYYVLYFACAGSDEKMEYWMWYHSVNHTGSRLARKI